MFAPHELKGKTFSKAVRGYSPNEVDDHIDFLIEQYTELYREYNELEHKLKIVVTNLDEIRDEEESIRSTLVKAQQLGEKIVREANEKADAITDSIKTRCEAIISDFRKQYSTERKEVWQLRNTVLDFKKNVYEIYRDHIEELQAISVNELEQLVIPEDTEVVGRILSDVKEAVETQVRAGEDIKREQDLNSSEEAASDLVKAIDGNDTSTKPADDDGNVVGGDDELDFVDKLDQV
jgi:divIVA domain